MKFQRKSFDDSHEISHDKRYPAFESSPTRVLFSVVMKIRFRCDEKVLYMLQIQIMWKKTIPVHNSSKK